MNLKKRPALFFVLTAFTVLVCRCGQVMTPAIQPILATDGSIVGSCESKQEVSESAEKGGDPVFTPVWECSVTCPDNSQVKFDSYTQPPVSISAAEKQAYLAQYCSPEAMLAPAASETPTETPVSIEATATATVTSTATATPADQVIVIPPQNLLILPPVLGGGVSACDTALGFINFPLSSQAPDLSERKVVISLNGREVNCVVSGSQGQVLGCSLPQGTTFPVTVKVNLDDVEVNNFSFDGGICTKTMPTHEREPDEPTGPTPTGPTAEPPVDCTIDPYNPAC